MVSTNSMRATFLYQAYGSWHFAKQAVLAVLSLLRHGVSPDDVIVFTDAPEEFADLKIHVLQATAATIKAWQRPYCHPHRLKIELIRHIFGSVKTPLVYLDSDTVWLNSPARGATPQRRSVGHARLGGNPYLACRHSRRDAERGLDQKSRAFVWSYRKCRNVQRRCVRFVAAARPGGFGPCLLDVRFSVHARATANDLGRTNDVLLFTAKCRSS